MGSYKRGKTEGIIILIVLILGIFLVVFMSLGEKDVRLSSPESCEIKARADCLESEGNYIVMGLSSETNAHGQNELFNQNYQYVLCCNFNGAKSCSEGDKNRILRLFSETNSHAEIPDGKFNMPWGDNIYGNNICYDNLDCSSTASNCGEERIEILSLSSETNAHIGKPGDYPYKICCDLRQIPARTYSEEIYWADNKGARISHSNVSETVRMYWTYSDFKNKEVVFEVWEDDPTTNVEIRTDGRGNEITATADNNGSVFAEWTITHDDYNRGKLSETGNPEYYFKVFIEGESKKKSSNLDVNISQTQTATDLAESCKEYTSESNCKNNPDKVGIYEGIYEFYDGNICEKRWNGTGCSWNGTKCNQKEVIQYNPENPKNCSQPILSSCEYSESVKPSDKCASGNEFYELIFSSVSASADCKTYSRKVYCRGKEVIKLPFFEGSELIISLILIELIYVLLIARKKYGKQGNQRFPFLKHGKCSGQGSFPSLQKRKF